MSEAPPMCKVSLRVTTLPSTTPEAEALYVAGSFNHWASRSEAHKLARGEDGVWSVQLQAREGQTLQYKFTRGSWDSVEISLHTELMPNRVLKVTKDGETADATIEGWRDLDGLVLRKHGISGRVEVIREFPVPQLGTTRRIWVYLPPDYDTSGKRYPVLYMHDGQNLFDPSTAYGGVEWQIDETLEGLSRDGQSNGVIVVAPDNGEANRLNEYGPWKDEDMGSGGQGAAYIEFLAYTLKPYVDTTFRTLRDRLFTGLAGSSMGGLISLYGGLRHPEVFSRIGAFSSSIWFAGRRILDEVRTWGKEGKLLAAGPMRVYLDVGGLESKSPEPAKAMVQDSVEMFYLLKELGFPDDQVKLVFDDQATHSESEWSKRFATAYLWLYEQQ